jgi:hypothetical protein
MRPWIDGAMAITIERARQLAPVAKGGEGLPPPGYDAHPDELLAAASCYIATARNLMSSMTIAEVLANVPEAWPWQTQYWKPSSLVSRNLEKAGALVAAAYDGLDR